MLAASSVTRSISESKTYEGKIEMRKQKGFSLIELLIVVAIILIIAAIAIPNLIRARMSANESSAVGSVRTINTAEISYNAAYPAQGFTSALTNLGGASPCTPSTTTGCFIDAVLSAANPATKSGYRFQTGAGACTASTPANCYAVSANPVTANQTGVRSFCSFEDAVVRYVTGGGIAVGTCPGATAPLQ
jgi:type IV pilus assembly protein PilA